MSKQETVEIIDGKLYVVSKVEYSNKETVEIIDGKLYVVSKVEYSKLSHDINYAIYKGNLDLIKALYEKIHENKYDINLYITNVQINHAIMLSRVDIVKFLITKWGDLRINEFILTAAAHREIEILDYLNSLKKE